MNVRNVLRPSVVPVPFENTNHPGEKTVNEQTVGTPSFLPYPSETYDNAHRRKTVKRKTRRWIETLVIGKMKDFT
jgi:hypothetical protein